jgi:hypothetical protein
MAFFNMAATGLMVQSVLLNAPSHPDTPFCMNSHLQTRLELSGITRTTVSDFFSIFRSILAYGISPGTQYCDGLRGAMAVYDPHDPHRSKYGQFAMPVILLMMLISCQI